MSIPRPSLFARRAPRTLFFRLLEKFFDRMILERTIFSDTLCNSNGIPGNGIFLINIPRRFSTYSTRNFFSTNLD